MQVTGHRLLIGSLVSALALALVVASCGGGTALDGGAAPASRDVSATTDATMAFWEQRIERDPRDFIALNQLADAYVRRARQRGDVADYARAEAALLASLEARPSGNYDATVQLGLVYVTTHRFGEALALGEQALALQPGKPFGYALLGDALLALGRYDEAEEAYETTLGLAPGLASYSRVAHLRELRGDLEGAERAWRDAAEIEGVARVEAAAWAHTQLGRFSLATGDPEGAERAYDDALARLPGYTPALAGLAAVRAAERDYWAAIALYETALERQPLLEHVVALGDVYAAAGEPERAASQYALVEAIERLYAANGIRTDLVMALYLADHDLRLDDALRQARAAYDARPGIEAADALAWALYKHGRFAEARAYSNEALRLGTRDPLLLFHAELIREAGGDAESARDALERALALNPRFSVLQADTAAAALERLEATVAGRR